MKVGIRGLKYHNQEKTDTIKEGGIVYLTHEPDNPVDSNAMKATWIDKDNVEWPIVYVRNDEAVELLRVSGTPSFGRVVLVAEDYIEVQVIGVLGDKPEEGERMHEVSTKKAFVSIGKNMLGAAGTAAAYGWQKGKKAAPSVKRGLVKTKKLFGKGLRFIGRKMEE